MSQDLSDSSPMAAGKACLVCFPSHPEWERLRNNVVGEMVKAGKDASRELEKQVFTKTAGALERLVRFMTNNQQDFDCRHEAMYRYFSSHSGTSRPGPASRLSNSTTTLRTCTSSWPSASTSWTLCWCRYSFYDSDEIAQQDRPEFDETLPNVKKGSGAAEIGGNNLRKTSARSVRGAPQSSNVPHCLQLCTLPAAVRACWLRAPVLLRLRVRGPQVFLPVKLILFSLNSIS